jgi:ABC-2 type transport system permease protein
MNRIIRHKQLFWLTMARAMELLREPGVLFWGIVFPILMSLGLGVAFTKKADTVRVVAVIVPGSANLQMSDSVSELTSFLQLNHAIVVPSKDGLISYQLTIPDSKLGNTTFIFKKMDWKLATVLLKRGNLNLILEEKNGKTEFHFDPLNPDAQLCYLRLSSMFNNPTILERESDESIKPLTVSGTRYIDFLVPGLIAMGVMMSIMWGVSYEIIDSRSKKLLRRMVATPMKKSHFLVALIAVRITMNFVESGLLFLVAKLVFGITIQGSIPALLTVFIAGNIVFAGIAILMSSHTSKTEIGNGLINLVSMPMMVLSGVFFSYHNFPEWSIPFIQKFPLTMLADSIRSVIIEGAGFAEIGMPSLIMSITGIIFFVVGLKIFKWH